MTTDEMRRQKADILLEDRETKEKLEHLKVKGRGLGELLTTMGKWLSLSPELTFFRHDQAHCGFLNVQVTSQKYIDALEPTQYFDLANEIRETAQKLNQLKETKYRLGLE